jgi:hypothetical protein
VLPAPPLSIAEWPMGPTLVSLSTTTVEAVHLSQASVEQHATSVYWVLYIHHVINTFNTFSWGPTHRSLTDTGGATTQEKEDAMGSATVRSSYTSSRCRWPTMSGGGATRFSGGAKSKKWMWCLFAWPGSCTGSSDSQT